MRVMDFNSDISDGFIGDGEFQPLPHIFEPKGQNIGVCLRGKVFICRVDEMEVALRLYIYYQEQGRALEDR